MKKSLPLAAVAAVVLSLAAVPAHAGQTQADAAASQQAQIQTQQPQTQAEQKGFFGRMGDSVSGFFSQDDRGGANTRVSANGQQYDAVGGVLVEGRTASGNVGNKTQQGTPRADADARAGANIQAIAPAAGAGINAEAGADAQAGND